jgi:hypothetical protein
MEDFIPKPRELVFCLTQTDSKESYAAQACGKVEVDGEWRHTSIAIQNSTQETIGDPAHLEYCPGNVGIPEKE